MEQASQIPMPYAVRLVDDSSRAVFRVEERFIACYARYLLPKAVSAGCLAALGSGAFSILAVATIRARTDVRP